MLVVSAIHLISRPISDAGIAAGFPNPGNGLGVYLAVAGGLAATVGALLWVMNAAHSPLHPLPSAVAWGRLIGLGIGVVLLLVAMFSGWSYDERQEAIITPEIQARIDELEQRAIDNPDESAAVAAEMLSIRAQAAQVGVRITDGITTGGPQLGLLTLILAVLALAAGLPAAGLFGRGEQWKWRWCSITAGLGSGIVAVCIAWIMTQVRSGHVRFVSGVGAFLALVGGAIIVASTMAVLKEFRRAKVYGDPLESAPGAGAAVEEKVGELV